MSSAKDPPPYIRRRAYSKIHVKSWVIYLEKDGYVRCPFKNCNFMAFDVEEMCNHYGFCTGENLSANFICEHCKGCTNDKKKLELHLQKAHNVTAVKAEPETESNNPEPPDKGKPSRVLVQSWGYFFEQHNYIKCPICDFLSNNLPEMCRHYSVCKSERNLLLYVCPECKGRTLTVNPLLWHLERSHNIFMAPNQFNHITKSMVRFWERELNEKGFAACLHITKGQRDCFFFDQKTLGILEHSQCCKGPQLEPVSTKMQCPHCRMWTSAPDVLQNHINCIHVVGQSNSKNSTTSPLRKRKQDLSRIVAGPQEDMKVDSGSRTLVGEELLETRSKEAGKVKMVINLDKSGIHLKDSKSTGSTRVLWVNEESNKGILCKSETTIQSLSNFEQVNIKQEPLSDTIVVCNVSAGVDERLNKPCQDNKLDMDIEEIICSDSEALTKTDNKGEQDHFSLVFSCNRKDSAKEMESNIVIVSQEEMSEREREQIMKDESVLVIDFERDCLIKTEDVSKKVEKTTDKAVTESRIASVSKSGIDKSGFPKTDKYSHSPQILTGINILNDWSDCDEVDSKDESFFSNISESTQDSVDKSLYSKDEFKDTVYILGNTSTLVNTEKSISNFKKQSKVLKIKVPSLYEDEHDDYEEDNPVEREAGQVLFSEEATSVDRISVTESIREPTVNVDGIWNKYGRLSIKNYSKKRFTDADRLSFVDQPSTSAESNKADTVEEIDINCEVTNTSRIFSDCEMLPVKGEIPKVTSNVDRENILQEHQRSYPVVGVDDKGELKLLSETPSKMNTLETLSSFQYGSPKECSSGGIVTATSNLNDIHLNKTLAQNKQEHSNNCNFNTRKDIVAFIYKGKINGQCATGITNIVPENSVNQNHLHLLEGGRNTYDEFSGNYSSFRNTTLFADWDGINSNLCSFSSYKTSSKHLSNNADGDSYSEDEISGLKNSSCNTFLGFQDTSVDSLSRTQKFHQFVNRLSESEPEEWCINVGRIPIEVRKAENSRTTKFASNKQKENIANSESVHCLELKENNNGTTNSILNESSHFYELDPTEKSFKSYDHHNLDCRDQLYCANNLDTTQNTSYMNVNTNQFLLLENKNAVELNVNNPEDDGGKLVEKDYDQLVQIKTKKESDTTKNEICPKLCFTPQQRNNANDFKTKGDQINGNRENKLVTYHNFEGMLSAQGSSTPVSDLPNQGIFITGFNKIDSNNIDSVPEEIDTNLKINDNFPRRKNEKGNGCDDETIECCDNTFKFSKEVKESEDVLVSIFSEGAFGNLYRKDLISEEVMNFPRYPRLSVNELSLTELPLTRKIGPLNTELLKNEISAAYQRDDETDESDSSLEVSIYSEYAIEVDIRGSILGLVKNNEKLNRGNSGSNNLLEKRKRGRPPLKKVNNDSLASSDIFIENKRKRRSLNINQKYQDFTLNVDSIFSEPARIQSRDSSPHLVENSSSSISNNYELTIEKKKRGRPPKSKNVVPKHSNVISQLIKEKKSSTISNFELQNNSHTSNICYKECKEMDLVSGDVSKDSHDIPIVIQKKRGRKPKPKVLLAQTKENISVEEPLLVPKKRGRKPKPKQLPSKELLGTDVIIINEKFDRHLINSKGATEINEDYNEDSSKASLVSRSQQNDPEQGRDDTDTDEEPQPKKSRPSKRLRPAEESIFTAKHNLQDKVTCGVCKEEMSYKQYKTAHAMNRHYMLCWLDREEMPVDMQDEKEVLKRLWYVKKREKKFLFRCHSCNIPKLSAVGFLSHIKFCGKQGEEVESLLWTCHLCGVKMMPSSKMPHLYQKHSSDKLSRGEVDSACIIPKAARAAATRAVEVIQSHTEGIKGEDGRSNDRPTSPGSNPLVSHMYSKPYKIIPIHLYRTCRKALQEKTVFQCLYEGCNEVVETTLAFRKHYFSCPFGPQQRLSQAYRCKVCSFNTECEKEIQQHVMDEHEDRVHNDWVGSDKSDDSDQECRPIIYNSAMNFKFLMFKDDKSRVRHKLSDSSSKQFFKEALKWTIELRRKCLAQDVLFSDVQIGNSTWHSLSLETATPHLPGLQTSIQFRGKDKCWHTLRRFQGTLVDGVPVIFAGGPVWATAWVPVPDNGNHHQYLAVATHPGVEETHEMSAVYNYKSLIQVWSFGHLNNCEPCSGETPKFLLGLAHSRGAVWALRWCPAGCHDDTRLGLLAAACSDGTVAVYCVPRYRYTFESVGMFTIYDMKPVLELKLGCEMLVQAVSLDWHIVSPHSVIAGGFANGMVALWDLHTKSSLLRDGNTIYPFRVVEAHHSAVTAVSLSPDKEGTRLMTASFDRATKFWRIDDMSAPVNINKKASVTDAAMPNNWMTSINCYDDVYNMNPIHVTGYNYRESFSSCNNNYLVQTGTVWSISFNDWLNASAFASEMGKATILFRKQLLVIEDPKKVKAPSVSGDIVSCNVQPLDNSDKTLVWEKSYSQCLSSVGLDINFKEDVMETTKLRIESTSDVMDRYPIQSINKVEWNPNLSSFTRLAVGMQCGLVMAPRTKFMPSKILTEFYKNISER